MKEKIYHFNATVYSRGQGHNFFQKLSYLDGNKYYDERTDQTFNYGPRKSKENIQNDFIAPANANDELKDRDSYYQNLNQKEKGTKAQLYREIEFSLFNNLSEDENKEVARRFAQTFVDEGYVADLNYHKLGKNNPHCHMVVPLRKIDAKGKLGNKDRDFLDKTTQLNNWRDRWEKVANEYFKEKGYDNFISSKSYEDRGLEKIPTRHLPRNQDSEKYNEVKEINSEIKRYNKVTEIEKKQEVVKRTSQERNDKDFKIFKDLTESKKSIEEAKGKITRQKNYTKQMKQNYKPIRSDFNKRTKPYRDNINSLKISNFELKNQIIPIDNFSLKAYSHNKKIEKQIIKNIVEIKKNSLSINKEKHHLNNNKDRLKYYSSRKELIKDKLNLSKKLNERRDLKLQLKLFLNSTNQQSQKKKKSHGLSR